MEINQIKDLLNNNVIPETLGESAITLEDLSQVVDLGTAVFNANAMDKYVKSLVNHIGRVVFVNRPYSGSAPSVLMDGWEFGSVLQKIQSELPEASINEDWELQDGQSYDPNIAYIPKVSAKFFNKRVTFEIDRTITEMQVKQSFSNAEQLNGFVSMIYNEIDKAMTINIDELVMRTINNMIAETFYDLNSAGSYTGRTGVRAVNLLFKYNTQFNQNLSADEALLTPEFIRYAALQMGLQADRMSKISKLFNIGNKARFTPKNLLHIVTLSDFQRAADVYLQSDTYHDEFTRLPQAETVPFWQGPGDDYDFDSVTNIHVQTASGHEVDATGVLAVMFDRDALGVTNLDRRVKTNYNPKAEFTNYFYKFDAGYFNDPDENFVVFYVA